MLSRLFHHPRLRTGFVILPLLFGIGFVSERAQAQAWPALTSDATASGVLGAVKRGPYGKIAQGRVIRETPVKGIYALIDLSGKFGPVFTDAKATRLKNGRDGWIDVASGRALSTTQVRALRADMAKRLDVASAIPFQYGNGQEQAILVSAYDCPYCKKLEEKLDGGSFNGKLYLFPMSLQLNKPGPMSLARDIWCSPQPGQAWKAAILNKQTPPPASAGCTKDARDASMLMPLFDIKAVPARINADGRISQM